MSIFDQIGSAFASDFVSGTTVNPQYQPPQRTWVGLTDEEIFTELERVDPETKRLPAGLKIFAHYLEARLKEKNNAS